jgi:hypothetical protein
MTLAAITLDVRAITGPAVPRVYSRGPGRAVNFGPMIHSVLGLPEGPEPPQALTGETGHQSHPSYQEQDARQADPYTFCDFHWSSTTQAGRKLPHV